MDWPALIWTVVWIVVGLIVLGFIAWVTVATIVAKNFKRVSKTVDSRFKDFDKAFRRF